MGFLRMFIPVKSELSKTYKMACASNKDRQSLHQLHEETMGLWLPIEHPMKPLISLCKCAG